MRPLALRAGGDRPHRSPAHLGGFATRTALFVLSALLLTGSLAGQASAQEVPPPPSPVVIGPGPALPPPPPSLPGSKHGKGGKGGKGAKTGNKTKGGRTKAGKAGGNAGLDLRANCAPFGYTQTYGSWGPAVAYGGPVTVVYEAERCSTPDGRSLDLAAEGTAKVFQGASEAGALLDTRPFLFTGTWKQPKNAAAWPLAWWDCSVPYASYKWEIPGLYTFEVTAQAGVWSLDVNSQGVGTQAVSWTHNGCAA
ncbi:MAG: hypothetical protein ACRDH9_00070 [Actinomycetota bacterium]